MDVASPLCCRNDVPEAVINQHIDNNCSTDYESLGSTSTIRPQAVSSATPIRARDSRRQVAETKDKPLAPIFASSQSILVREPTSNAVSPASQARKPSVRKLAIEPLLSASSSASVPEKSTQVTNPNSGESMFETHSVTSTPRLNNISTPVSEVRSGMKRTAEDIPNEPASPLAKRSKSSDVLQLKHQTQAQVPLAERLRPSKLEDFVGHLDLVGPNSPIMSLIDKGQLTGIIMYGPPG